MILKCLLLAPSPSTGRIQRHVYSQAKTLIREHLVSRFICDNHVQEKQKLLCEFG